MLDVIFLYKILKYFQVHPTKVEHGEIMFRKLMISCNVRNNCDSRHFIDVKGLTIPLEVFFFSLQEFFKGLKKYMLYKSSSNPSLLQH
jgi:hypothetical protein